MKLLLLCAALAWPIAASDVPHVMPKLRTGKVIAGSAIVMPAHVTYSRRGMKSAEGMEEQASTVASRLYAAICSELSIRGMTVLPNPDQPAAGDAAKYRIADLQNRFDQVRLPMSRRPGRVGRGDYTLGDTVATFEPGKSNVVVFLRGEGQTKTGGSKALGAVVLNPMLAWSRFRGDVTFVDSVSGEVLAFVPWSILQDLTRSTEDQLRTTIRHVLRPLPLPTSPAR